MSHCFDCAYCSVVYPSLIDWCDSKEQKINNVYAEHDCSLYVESEDESEGDKE